MELSALAISSLPVLIFSSFLYYTDTLAVFSVLLMYVLHLHGNNNMAGIVGFVSVIVRQTNIIWVFMVSIHIKFIFKRFQFLKYFDCVVIIKNMPWL